MLSRLAELARRRRRALIVGVLIVVGTAAVVGGGVRDRLSVGGFTDPAAEANEVEEALVETFGAAPANHVLVVTMKDEWVYSEANEAAGLALTARLAGEPGVTDVTSYWSLGELPPPSRSPLRDRSGTRALVGMRLVGSEDEQRATAERLADHTGETEHFVIEAAGAVEVSREAAELAESDLTRAELLAAPLTLLALVLAFRGLRAGLLPLVVAVVAVLGTFAVLSVIAVVVDVSVFAVNLTTALGLGLAIDYSLLIVARYREELAAGRDPDRALRRTLQTAGRTVAFSAATVAASLVALTVFPVVYLRSFAYAGVVVVAGAAASALVVLPALLGWLGPRVGAASARRSTGEPFWGRQARRVLRRPLAWALGSGVLLAALAVPFLGVAPGRLDDRALPADASARQAAGDLRSEFTFTETSPYAVFAPGGDPDDVESIRAYEDAVLEIPGVRRVDSTLGFRGADGRVAPLPYNERFGAGPGDGVWFSIVGFDDPGEGRASALVDALRSTPGSYDRVLVGGPVAAVSDTVDGVLARLPVALGIIAVVTLTLLFLLTGSVVIPLKAVVLNLLSLTATFGALVWIFQDGHLSGQLGFTPTGELDVFTPILMFCIAFGLSMDYEVFVLARIKEEYDLSGSNRHAIVAGLSRTGGLVTAAAVILTIVFLAIATSGVTVVKMFGVGLALAVVLDAFVVRATLTPALMALAGRWNWWAPRSMRRFHLRWGLWENDPVEVRP